MKKDKKDLGFLLTGSLHQSGVTIYKRNDQLITRTATSDEKRSNTLPQFIQRQKMRHTMALWKMLKHCKPMFTERQTAYLNFASIANHLPVVYLKKGRMTEASFLMPGIPVSDGTLPTVNQAFGALNGVPALVTDLKEARFNYNEQWWLYTAVQTDDGIPHVRFSKREVSHAELVVVDGHLGLVGKEFGDEDKGWALVRVVGDRCSPQTIVTRCTRYQAYTTDEALKEAAESYGGLTETPFPQKKIIIKT